MPAAENWLGVLELTREFKMFLPCGLNERMKKAARSLIVIEGSLRMPLHGDYEMIR